jgi:coenzyme F420-0:L-glutamate ligase/coenzyme F420-1:gamma-L-glutamate ligase
LIQVIPIRIRGEIRRGDDLAAKIFAAAENAGTALVDGDILVVAHKAVSKAEGRIVDLTKVKPSKRALGMAREHQKDPRLLEIILKESRRIVRARKGVIIAETRHGFVCANAGVDQSNVMEDQAVLLPLDPDRSASQLRQGILKRYNKIVSVVITDTFGRPFRNGQTNVAIGVSGIDPIKSYIGTSDMYGKKLRVTEIAVADEISSAGELVMGKSDWVPAAIVRGYEYSGSRKSSSRPLLRKREQDLFR